MERIFSKLRVCIQEKKKNDREIPVYEFSCINCHMYLKCVKTLFTKIIIQEINYQKELYVVCCWKCWSNYCNLIISTGMRYLPNCVLRGVFMLGCRNSCLNKKHTKNCYVRENPSFDVLFRLCGHEKIEKSKILNFRHKFFKIVKSSIIIYYLTVVRILLQIQEYFFFFIYIKIRSVNYYYIRV